MRRVEVVVQPAGGIGQAVVAVIDDLQEHLRQPEHGPGYIHRIRVDIKRLRAWLRLVRKDAAFDWRALDRELRDAARRLSPSRDARVILDTLKCLEKKAGDREKQALALLRSRMYFDPEGRDIDWTGVMAPLAETAEALRGPAMELESPAIVRRGLKRCYKRAVREGRRAFSGSGTSEDLHELRKWVKYLYYQLGYVNRARPGRYGRDRKRYHKLGDRLGRIHDLVLVQKRLERLDATEECARESALAQGLTRKRMNKLLGSCRRLYRKGFHASPSRFVQPLA